MDINQYKNALNEAAEKNLTILNVTVDENGNQTYDAKLILGFCNNTEKINFRTLNGGELRSPRFVYGNTCGIAQVDSVIYEVTMEDCYTESEGWKVIENRNNLKNLATELYKANISSDDKEIEQAKILYFSDIISEKTKFNFKENHVVYCVGSETFNSVNKDFLRYYNETENSQIGIYISSLNNLSI